MGLWARDHHGQPVRKGLVWHSDAGSQYTSFTFTERLIDAGVDGSIGSVGDAYDNALAETTIGLYKTELIRRVGRGRRSSRSSSPRSSGWTGTTTHGFTAPAEHPARRVRGTPPHRSCCAQAAPTAG